MPMPSGSIVGRVLWLVAACAALIALATIDYYVAAIHVGALAVIPLFFIAMQTGRYPALVAAAITAIVFAFFNQNTVANAGGLRAGVAVDAIMLGLSYLVIIELVLHVKRMVSERIAVEDDLRAAQMKAERDPLTGLPNRAVFMNRLQFLAGHSTTRFAVLFGDLDRFKEVNDAHGHALGDRVLHLAGQRISHALRANDFVGRIGGDEFAVLLYGIHDRTEADAIVKKIEASFSEPFVEADTAVSIGITLGVSHFPDDARNAEALLCIADDRMYARKPTRRVSTGVITPRARRRRLTQTNQGAE